MFAMNYCRYRWFALTTLREICFNAILPNYSESQGHVPSDKSVFKQIVRDEGWARETWHLKKAEKLQLLGCGEKEQS